MKKTLFVLMTTICAVSFAQNLKPMDEQKKYVQVPPTNKTYINLKNVCFELKGNSIDITGFLTKFLNNEVYSVKATPQESEFRVQYFASQKTTSPLRVTSETNSRVAKDGKTITTTKYTASSTEMFNVSLSLIDASGTIVKTYTSSNSKTISAMNNSDQSARTDYGNTLSKEVNIELDYVIKKAWSELESEYLIARKLVQVSAIEIKSRKFDYTDMNEAAVLVDTWFKTGATDLSDANIMKALSVYESVAQEHVPDEKKVRVNDEIAAVCYYQMATIHLCVKNYVKAQELVIKSESLDKRIHFTQEQMKVTLALMKERGAF